MTSKIAILFKIMFFGVLYDDKSYDDNDTLFFQDISKGKIGSKDIKESVVIIMGAIVHKLCQKGGCELPVSKVIEYV